MAKIKCTVCGSGETYLRLKSKERVCRQCGNTFKEEIKFSEVKNE